MILVTGANGQLGFDVCNALKANGQSYIGTDIDTLDITDEKRVRDFFEKYDLEAVIHCAAYTAVDKAEDDYDTCYRVNFIGTQNLAVCCREKNIKMLYVSTDYVFSGDGTEPYETDGKINPQSVYAKSKLMGEVIVSHLCQKHFIVRTSWVFGEKNTNFIYTMLKLSSTNKSVKVVCDQVGSPTYSRHLARLLSQMIASEKYGFYHATNEGFCSWYELAKKTFEIAKKDTEVFPVTTESFGSKAQRPHNSRLSKKSLDEAGFSRLPSWEDAVKEYLSEIC